jgi:glutamine synthetase
MMTISGDYPEDGNGFEYPEDDGDLKLVPDLSTLCVVPWEEDPTAQVICDLVHRTDAWSASRHATFCAVCSKHDARGLKAVVAPEIEFYLVRRTPT